MARYWNDGSYDREELNADNRRKVMDVWKRFESSKTGVWLSRHTHLLERLSDEESHLVVRAGAMVCVFALILSMIMFLLVKGGMLAWTLLTLPVFAIAFMLVMVLWIFWDAYRDSGERAADWLSTRPGVAPGVRSPRITVHAPSTVTCFPPSCRACLRISVTASRAPFVRAHGMRHGMWAIRGTWRCGWVPNGTSTCWVLPVPARPSASSSPAWSRLPASCSRPPREATSSKRPATCANAV